MGKLKRKLKTTTISGNKQIVPWVERLNYFNDYFRSEGYTLQTNLIEMNDSIIVIQGIVINKDDKIVADGIAHKRTTEPFSFQKCQSGALNRALFILGIVNQDEDTIMDEDEAKELSNVKAQDSQSAYDNMLEYIDIDFKVVEQRLPSYKDQFTSEQVSTIKKKINAKKSSKAVAQASK